MPTAKLRAQNLAEFWDSLQPLVRSAVAEPSTGVAHPARGSMDAYVVFNITVRFHQCSVQTV